MFLDSFIRLSVETEGTCLWDAAGIFENSSSTPRVRAGDNHILASFSQIEVYFFVVLLLEAVAGTGTAAAEGPAPPSFISGHVNLGNENWNKPVPLFAANAASSSFRRSSSDSL